MLGGLLLRLGLAHGAVRFGGDDLPKPSVIVMAYTGHSDYSASEPPTFVVVGERDGIAPPSVMERRVKALRSTGVDVEFHRYPDAGHGFGAGTGTSGGMAGAGRTLLEGT